MERERMRLIISQCKDWQDVFNMTINECFDVLHLDKMITDKELVYLKEWIKL